MVGRREFHAVERTIAAGPLKDCREETEVHVTHGTTLGDRGDHDELAAAAGTRPNGSGVCRRA
jgi:hypothetical protein